MNAGFLKLIDQTFMTHEQAEIIENALSEKASMIVSGHKGWGILPLLATLGAAAKEQFSVKQVKGFDCLEEPSDYYVIASPKETDFEGLIMKAFSVPNAATLTLKDPDHPYSIMKALKDVYKQTKDVSKTYLVLECAKVNEEKVLSKITRMSIDEGGKLQKIDL